MQEAPAADAGDAGDAGGAGDAENARGKRVLWQPWPIHPLLRPPLAPVAVNPTAATQLMERFADDDDLFSVLLPALTLRSILALPIVNKAWRARRGALLSAYSPWKLIMLSESEYDPHDRGLLEAMATQPHPLRYRAIPPRWAYRGPIRLRVSELYANAKLALHPTAMDRVVLQIDVAIKWRFAKFYHRMDVTVYVDPMCERLRLTPFHSAHVWQLGKTLRTGVWINRRLEPLQHCKKVGGDRWTVTRYKSDGSRGPWLRVSRSINLDEHRVDVDLGAVGKCIPGATPQFQSSRGTRPRRLYLCVRMKRGPPIEPILLPNDMTDFLLDMCRGVQRDSGS